MQIFIAPATHNAHLRRNKQMEIFFMAFVAFVAILGWEFLSSRSQVPVPRKGPVPWAFVLPHRIVS